MADADRPLSGSFDHASDEWRFDDASDEWTEPMSRAGTDPFDTPARPARGQPGDRVDRRADRRADRRGRQGVPGTRGVAAGRTGVIVGALGGLATAVAVAASLVLVVVAPDESRESSEAPREPRWFPISELSAPAASFAPAVPDPFDAFDAFALPAGEPAKDAICELDPLAPAPALPAADPPTARKRATEAGDGAIPDEPTGDDPRRDSWGTDATGRGNDAGSTGDNARDRQREPGSETPAP